MSPASCRPIHLTQAHAAIGSDERRIRTAFCARARRGAMRRVPAPILRLRSPGEGARIGAGGQGNGEVKVEAPLRLELVGVSKSFPGVRANDNVHLKVKPGEIHALLGENGAGKSTLVKMIYGIQAPDEGQILFDGAPVRISNPRAARRLGIGMVFQHFSLFEALTVLENIALGLDARLSQRELLAEFHRVLDALSPQARSAPDRLDAQRRRAAANRDRARAAAQSAPPDHGRADLGADAAGGRATVRGAAPPRRERLLDPLHLPQAARDRRALRYGHDPARRQGGRNRRSQARDVALDGGNDDRRQSQGDLQAGGAGVRPAEARSPGPQPAEAHRIRRRAAGRHALRAGGRGVRRRGRRGQRAERAARRAERRNARRGVRGP